MSKEKIELPNHDELIGQTVKWKCGTYHDIENQQDQTVDMYAKGTVLSCTYDPMNDQFSIRIHFVHYKKWSKWKVPEYMSLFLHEIELESGFRFGQ